MSSRIRHDTVTRTVTIDDGQEVTHRCLAADRCRAPETVEDGSKQPATTERPNSVCRRCYSAIRLAAEDLPQDHADLLAAIGEHTRIPGEKVHASANASQSPIDVIKHDLARDIEHHMRIAAHRIHTTRNTETPAPTQLAECSALVVKHLDLLITSGEQLEQEWCGRGESVLIAGQYRANTRIVKRTGIDTALHLVDLRKQARSRLAGTTTKLFRLSAHFPGCNECGERMYSDGRKVICRACDRDWTEETGGIFNAELKRQAELERQQRMDELTAQLELVTEQRDTAWARLDAFRRFLDSITDILPNGVGLAAHQLTEALNPYLDGHPTPEQRQTTSEATT